MPWCDYNLNATRFAHINLEYCFGWTIMTADDGMVVLEQWERHFGRKVVTWRPKVCASFRTTVGVQTDTPAMRLVHWVQSLTPLERKL